MPFDASMTSASVAELKKNAVGARVEKIYQPEKDEVIFLLNKDRQNIKMQICVRSGMARIGETHTEKTNPVTAPMFCMLLRKYLSGSHIESITQLGFERAVRIVFATYDELGFASNRSIIVEITGRYGNIIFCDKNEKVISALHLSDISSNDKRKLMCGFAYEPLPLPENRCSPLGVTKEEFERRIGEFVGKNSAEYPADKFLVSSYAGISPLIAREIVFRTAKDPTAFLSNIDTDKFYFQFKLIFDAVANGDFCPYLLYEKNGKVLDISFCEIRQYGNGAVCKKLGSFAELFDTYFEKKDLAERIRQNGQDILKLLSNASIRIAKKTELQRADLAKCADMAGQKLIGDLITANIYRIKKGDATAELVDYSDPGMKSVTVTLDPNLTPAQNAQRYYKKYNKYKTAEVMLKQQLELSRLESEYLDTVFESLTKAVTEDDLNEIRDELTISGYGRKLASLSKTSRKKNAKKLTRTYRPMRFKTSGGIEVLCGKNNLQNDYITTSVGEKDDYWFHIKGYPGSHVLLRCGKTEPDAVDFTECAMIAAYYSKARKLPSAPVDYTRIRNVRKPSGAKPGYVTYDKNFTAYVTANKELPAKLSVK